MKLCTIFAVVTGCSKGIGLSYAHELAKKRMNLMLIARKADLLNQIANDIKKQYGVQVEVIVADFGLGSSIYKRIEEVIAGMYNTWQLRICIQSFVYVVDWHVSRHPDKI